MSDFEFDGASRFIVFSTGDDSYCVPLGVVRQVVGFRGVTPIPSDCRWLLGVVNVRGALVPVLDLAARFGDAATVLSDRACIFVVETGAHEEIESVGFVAQRVEDLIVIADAGQIVPAPLLMREAKLQFIRGMVRVNDALVTVIDPVRAFDVHLLAGAIRESGEEIAEISA